MTLGSASGCQHIWWDTGAAAAAAGLGTAAGFGTAADAAAVAAEGIEGRTGSAGDIGAAGRLGSGTAKGCPAAWLLSASAARDEVEAGTSATGLLERAW